MKKLLSIAVGALMLGSAVNAAVYTDFDNINRLVNGNNPYYGTFNIVTGDGGALDHAGFNNATETVVSGLLEFTLWDDSLFDGSETFSINLDSSLFINGGAAFAIVVDSLSADLVASLNADGILNYTVTATRGDFRLVNAGLTAVTVPIRSNSVPDGGTSAVLLGLGLCGLAAVRRFRK